MAGFLRAPLLLFRFPATLLAVLVASLLLAVAGAASPLFVSSAGNAAFQREIASDEGRIPAFEIRKPSAVVDDIVGYRDAVVRRYLDLPGLGEPIRAGVGSLGDVSVPNGAGGRLDIRVMTRQGAFDHVEVVEGGEGEGVWLSDRVANVLGIHAGDPIVVARLGDAGFRTRVTAVYHDLYLAPSDPYWTPFTGIIFPADPDDSPPPSFLLVSERTFNELQPRLNDRAEFVWDVPLEGVTSLDEARVLAGRLRRLGGTLSDETTQLGAALASARYQTPIPTYVESADRTVTAILTPIETISLAGRGVAMAVVIAAGVYVVRRRRVEFALLAARGVSPARLGVRVAVEALIAVAAGGAAGIAAAVGLVAALGPGTFTRDSIEEAATAAAFGAGAALIAIGVSAAASVRGLEGAETRRTRGVVSRIPWEVIVLTLAAAALYEAVLRGGAPLVDARGTVTIDRLLLLFPLLLLAGGAGLAVRVLRRVLPRLRRIGARRSAAVYLSSRRLAGAPRTAGLLVTASALGLGMLAYASLLSGSIRASADVKAHVAVGSDVAADVVGLEREPDLPMPATHVSVVDEVVLVPSETAATLLAVRAETFAGAAFWDRSFGGTPEELLRALDAGAGGDGLPVALVGDAGIVETLNVAGRSVPVTVVRRLDAVPGMPATRPAVVVLAGRLDAVLGESELDLADAGARDEVWARGDAEDVRRALEEQGATVTAIRTVQEVRDTPSFQSLAWTFGFLEALGVAAGLIALVGLVLYLQTRQRSREISYALARRMGLTRGAHRRSVLFELTGMLVIALAIGAGLALAAALLVYRRLDPLPALPPGPVLRAPLALLAISAGAILLAAWTGARLVQRRADRANVAEVMRAA